MKVKETTIQTERRGKTDREGRGDRSIPNLSFTFDAAEFLTGLSKVSNERARPQRHYRVSGRSSLLKDSGSVSIASSTIPVYRPVLNGRSNAKWIQTAANRVAGAPYESACWKLAPRRHWIAPALSLNASRDSQNCAATPHARVARKQFRNFVSIPNLLDYEFFKDGQSARRNICREISSNGTRARNEENDSCVELSMKIVAL